MRQLAKPQETTHTGETGLAHKARSTRNRLLGVLAAVAVLITIPGLPAFAATSTIVLDDIRYSYDSEAPEAGATVEGSNLSSGADLVIPPSVTINNEAYEVVEVADRAFYKKS